MGAGSFATIYKEINVFDGGQKKKILKKENNEFASVVEPPHIHIQHMETPHHTDGHPHAHTHPHAST